MSEVSRARSTPQHPCGFYAQAPTRRRSPRPTRRSHGASISRPANRARPTHRPGQSVLIRFPDGSHALFRFAFAVADEAAGEVAVFTEYCGYHVFPAGDVEVETLQAV